MRTIRFTATNLEGAVMRTLAEPWWIDDKETAEALKDAVLRAWQADLLDISSDDLHKFIEFVLDFGKSQEEIDELQVWMQNSQNSKPPRQKLLKVGSKKGYVYLLQSPTSAWKIGRTRSPNDRLKTFVVKLPFEVDYTAVIKTDDMYKLEADLHQKFSSKRIDGEWFNLSAEDVEYIKGLADAEN